MIILAPEAILAPTCIECTLRSSSKIFGEIISGHTSTALYWQLLLLWKGSAQFQLARSRRMAKVNSAHCVGSSLTQFTCKTPVNYDNNNRLFPGLAFINKFYKNFGQIFSSYLRIFESFTTQLRLISHWKINKLNKK